MPTNSDENAKVRVTEKVTDESRHLKLSARDSVRVMELLENPPMPNAKMLAAAHALPPRRT